MQFRAFWRRDSAAHSTMTPTTALKAKLDSIYRHSGGKASEALSAQSDPRLSAINETKLDRGGLNGAGVVGLSPFFDGKVPEAFKAIYSEEELSALAALRGSPQDVEKRMKVGETALMSFSIFQELASPLRFPWAQIILMIVAALTLNPLMNELVSWQAIADCQLQNQSGLPLFVCVTNLCLCNKPCAMLTARVMQV